MIREPEEGRITNEAKNKSLFLLRVLRYFVVIDVQDLAS
jgi:hypothetical protein